MLVGDLCFSKSTFEILLLLLAKSLQSCPILCDPRDGSPLGSPVPGILQARTLEWVAISFSSAWKWKVKVKSLSLVRLFVTPWTVAHQAPPSMGFSRQEHWSGVSLPSPFEILLSSISHPLNIQKNIFFGHVTGLWDLSSLTKDWTQAHSSESVES